MSESQPSESTSILLEQAHSALKAGNLDAAGQLYREAGTQSEDKTVIAEAADGLQACGLHMKAMSMLEDAVRRWPGSFMLLLRAADAYAGVGNFSRAAVHMRRLVDCIPMKSTYWMRLGYLYLAANEWTSAEEAFRKTLAISPLDIQAAMGRGEALCQLGRREDAVTCFRRIIAVLPDHIEALVMLGNLLLADGHVDEASEMLKKAVKHDPTNAGAHMGLGIALQARGEDGEAEAACRTALKLAPESPLTREALGTVLLYTGKIKEAADVLRLVNGDHASVGGLLGRFAAENLLENYTAAERALHQVLRLEPKNEEARHLLAALNGEPVAQAPAGFTGTVFNRIARRFDKRMTADLRYRMPQEVAAMILKAKGKDKTFSRLLDVGCGTGLAAAALDDFFTIEEKIGVDLSPGMLDVAAKKGVYHQVICGDAADALREADKTFDLVTAIDVLMYIGDVRELIDLVASRLEPGGLFAFTHESLNEGQFRLRTSGRFAHSAAYIEQTALSAGLKGVTAAPVTLRYDTGEEAAGVVSLLQRQV